MQWITPWAYNDSTSKKRSEHTAWNKHRTKVSEMLPFVLCVSHHPLLLALLVHPWEEEKLHPHFELVRLVLRYKYLHMTLGVYRLPIKLHRSEQISSFLVLCSQSQIMMCFHGLLLWLLLQYHLSILVVYCKNSFPIHKRSSHCQSSHVLQWIAVLQGFRYTTKVILVCALCPQTWNETTWNE